MEKENSLPNQGRQEEPKNFGVGSEKIDPFDSFDDAIKAIENFNPS